MTVVQKQRRLLISSDFIKDTQMFDRECPDELTLFSMRHTHKMLHQALEKILLDRKSTHFSRAVQDNTRVVFSSLLNQYSHRNAKKYVYFELVKGL